MTTLLKLATRWRSRASWSDPARKVKSLESFAQTEEDSGWDLLAAAKQISDPELREHMLRHAGDEARHARLFQTRAAELRAELPNNRAQGDAPDRPYDMSRGRRKGDVNAHGFFSAGLMGELGVVDYLTMLHVAEQRAADLFEVHRELNAGDPATVALFDSVLRDEKYHVAYTRRFLDRWTDEGRGGEVRRGLKAAKGSRLLAGWKRLGVRSGADSSRLLLFVLYWTALAPFGLLARLGRGGSGWQAPRRSPGAAAGGQF